MVMEHEVKQDQVIENGYRENENGAVEDTTAYKPVDMIGADNLDMNDPQAQIEEDYPDVTDGNEILKMKDRIVRRVVVPEWRRSFYVRSMTGLEREAFEESMIVGKGRQRDFSMRYNRAKACVLCVITGPDPESPRLWKESDVVPLSRKNAKALDRLYDVASDLSGITEKDTEEVRKNSGRTLKLDS